MPKDRLQEYAERMAETVRARREIYQKELRKYAEQAAKLDSEIVAIRSMCPHLRTQHFPRKIAEEDSFDVCEDCGETLK